MKFNALKYLEKPDKTGDHLGIEKDVFDTDKELIEKVNHNGLLNDVSFTVSTGGVLIKDDN